MQAGPAIAEISDMASLQIVNEIAAPNEYHTQLLFFILSCSFNSLLRINEFLNDHQFSLKIISNEF